MTTLIDKYKRQYPWLKNFTHLKGTDVWVGEVDPKLLPPNPKNWRIHSQRQRATYKAFKEKFGFLGLALFNLGTNRLLDGHMRVDEAIKNDQPTIPIIVVDEPDETRENEILATLDNIGLLAQRNEQALRSLTKAIDQKLETIKTDADRKLKQLRKDIQETEVETGPLLKQSTSRIRPLPPPEEEESKESEEQEDSYQSLDSPEDIVKTFVNSYVEFDGVTDLGIPELLKFGLATPDLAPRRTYPEEPYEEAYHCYSQSFDGSYYPGCVGFYTHDERFEAIFNEVDSFIDWAKEIQPKCFIGPDFSAYTTWPKVKSLYSVYKSRWCTRLWQECGFKVIPTVQIIDEAPYTLTTKYVLETLPTKATLSIECRGDEDKHQDKSFPKLIRWINKIITVCKPECLLLYGGLEKQKYVIGDIKAPKTELIFIPQISTVKQRNRRRR